MQDLTTGLLTRHLLKTSSFMLGLSLLLLRREFHRRLVFDQSATLAPAPA